MNFDQWVKPPSNPPEDFEAEDSKRPTIPAPPAGSDVSLERLFGPLIPRKSVEMRAVTKTGMKKAGRKDVSC